MGNPFSDILWTINGEVSELSGTALDDMAEVLDTAEDELSLALADLKILGKGEETFTAQVYRNSLAQIRGALDAMKHRVSTGTAAALKYGGKQAGALATAHLIQEVEKFSTIFSGTLRPIALETAAVLRDGNRILWPRFENSAARYAGAIGDDIRKQLAIGVVKGETIDQLTTRLAKMGGPKGWVATQGKLGSGKEKAEFIAEGLFKRYRSYGERLARTETVHAYNQIARIGIENLDSHDDGYYKRWDAAIDGRTCAQCGALDNIVRKPDATFPGGYDAPPAHPNCRCACVAWRKEWNEHDHKDDLVSETVKGQEPGGVKSIPHTVIHVRSDETTPRGRAPGGFVERGSSATGPKPKKLKLTPEQKQAKLDAMQKKHEAKLAKLEEKAAKLKAKSEALAAKEAAKQAKTDLKAQALAAKKQAKLDAKAEKQKAKQEDKAAAELYAHNVFTSGGLSGLKDELGYLDPTQKKVFLAKIKAETKQAKQAKQSATKEIAEKKQQYKELASQLVSQIGQDLTVDQVKNFAHGMAAKPLLQKAIKKELAAKAKLDKKLEIELRRNNRERAKQEKQAAPKTPLASRHSGSHWGPADYENASTAWHGTALESDGRFVENHSMNVRKVKDANGHEFTEVTFKVTNETDLSGLGEAFAPDGYIKKPWSYPAYEDKAGKVMQEAPAGGQNFVFAKGNQSLEDMPCREYKGRSYELEIGTHGHVKNLVRMKIRGNGEAVHKAISDFGSKIGADLHAKPTHEDVQDAVKRKIVARWNPHAYSEYFHLTGANAKEKFSLEFDRLAKSYPYLQDVLRDAKLMEVYPGKIAPYSESLAKYFEGKKLYHDGSSGVSILSNMLGETGGMSTHMRYSNGIFKNGMSSFTDMSTGGADGFFTRLHDSDPSTSNSSDSFRLVIDSKQLGRMDWWAYSSDNYGATYTDTGMRAKPTDVIKERWQGRFMKTDYKGASNEVIFQNGIPPEGIERIIVSPNQVKPLQDELTKRGITHIGGRSIKDVVRSK